jgi:allose kinase
MVGSTITSGAAVSPGEGRKPNAAKSAFADQALGVIEIGGTSVKIGFAVANQPLATTRSFATALIRAGEPLQTLARLFGEACREAAVDPYCAVVTVPGFIDRDFDRVIHAANVPELNGRRVASELTQILGISVTLERDVVLQLLGESRAGTVIGEQHVLGVFIGTGIGAAYLVEKSVFRGGGWALEIGHMPVHGTGRSLPGLLPNRLEVYASGRALAVIAERHGHPIASIFTASRSSARLRRELTNVVRDQAYAIATSIALLSPRVVLLGGGVIDMVDYPRGLLKQIVEQHLPLPTSLQPFDLRWAQLGWKAAIFGAIEILQR